MQQRAIEIEQADMTIRGMSYRPNASGRSPTVLLLHGFTGQRIENGFLFVHLARALAQRGIAAVTFDFRHSGESDGSFEQMLVTGELADAMRVTEWCAAQPFVDRSRLGLLGFSLGGLVAACAVGRTSVYRSLALIAPTTVENLCRFAGEGAGPVVRGPHTLHPRFFDDVRTLAPVDDCIAHPRPTLLVQGTGDQAVPPHVSQVYADRLAQAGAPAQRLTIDGADHGFSSPAWRKTLIAGVCEFFAKTL